MRRTIFLLAMTSLAFALSACTGTVVVPPVSVETPSGMSPIPGRYAASIQTGGWAMDVKAKGFTCSAWSFDADLNAAYSDAVKSILTGSLEQVEFVQGVLQPADLAAKGYDAQLVIQQTNASAHYAIATGLFTGTASSHVTLNAILAITNSAGLAYQSALEGSGGGDREIFTCNTAGEAIGTASQSAIRALAKDIALYARDGLRDLQARAASPPAVTPASAVNAGGS